MRFALAPFFVLALFAGCSADDSVAPAPTGSAGGMATAGSGGGALTGGASGAGGSAGSAGSGGLAGGAGGAVIVPAKVGMCTGTAPADPLAAQRTACTFAAGARVADTLGLDDAKRKSIPLQHIVIVMKENRSFDHLLGQLWQEGQPDAEPAPADFQNPDANGVPVPRFHQKNSCYPADPDHQWEAMHEGVDGGKMDGFVQSAAKSTTGNVGHDGHFVMGYFDAGDMPFLNFLATQFALADRHFPSLLTGTWPNRDFLLFATNDGVHFTGDGFPMAPSIMDSLDTAGVTWTAYTDGTPFEFANGWLPGHKGTAKMKAFYAALADGTLPAVSFVDGRPNLDDEHPPADVQLGEDWTRSVYQALVTSPLWASSAMIFTYDEGGGFHDHVPPPHSCVPDAKDADATELGVRVPLIVVSPYARHHYVSHVQHEHTSITRLVEAVFDLPALTARDANSDALLDMFDFDCAPTELLPDTPKAGAGECMMEPPTEGAGGSGGGGGSAGTGGSAGGGTGGTGGVGGGKGSECGGKATKAACLSCCDVDFPFGKVKLDTATLSDCGCAAGATCAASCTASCPGGPADDMCAMCLATATTSSAACAKDARTTCSEDSDCVVLLSCDAACQSLP